VSFCSSGDAPLAPFLQQFLTLPLCEFYEALHLRGTFFQLFLGCHLFFFFFQTDLPFSNCLYPPCARTDFCLFKSPRWSDPPEEIHGSPTNCTGPPSLLAPYPIPPPPRKIIPEENSHSSAWPPSPPFHETKKPSSHNRCPWCNLSPVTLAHFVCFPIEKTASSFRFWRSSRRPRSLTYFSGFVVLG